MRLFIAITDGDWFNYLSSVGDIDEVNFWQPTATVPFKALNPGEPLLFKLHSPFDFVVGGGFFSHYTTLPVSLAWDAFGIKNGARTQEEMRSRLERYRRTQPIPSEDYEIGCILLQAPFFFKRADWIPVPGWSPSIVRGKGFNSTIEPGRSLWDQVRTPLTGVGISPREQEQPTEGARFGDPQTVLPRLGQGSFRIIVTDAYRRRCAVTGSPILYVLEAAHIKPYPLGGPHSLENGILLREDVHTLFDRGYVTVTPDYKIEVSRRIKEEFDNGKEYYALHGKSIAVPLDDRARPLAEYLRWHNSRVYRG